MITINSPERAKQEPLNEEQAKEAVNEINLLIEGINTQEDVNEILLQALLDDYQNMREAKQWISVEDEKPKAGEPVLLMVIRGFYNSKPIVIGEYSGSSTYPEYYSYSFHEDEDIKVTHWQPLPPAPSI